MDSTTPDPTAIRPIDRSSFLGAKPLRLINGREKEAAVLRICCLSMFSVKLGLFLGLFESLQKPFRLFHNVVLAQLLGLGADVFQVFRQ